MTVITHDEVINRTLAAYLRKASALHEASWNPQHRKVKVLRFTAEGRTAYGPDEEWQGQYTKTQSDCIREVVGNDPIALILDCLFTAGYCEMWDFCDQVLGKEAEGRKPSETGEG